MRDIIVRVYDGLGLLYVIIEILM